MRGRSSAVLLAVLLLFGGGAAADDRWCIYQDNNGVHQVRGYARVPSHARRSARCFEQGDTPPLAQRSLAAPDDITLKGTLRREDMASSVGRIEMRWPRKVETLFGRTPQRAMAEAARAVSRALKSAGFPPELQTLDLNWKVVFLDEELPEQQIPTFLISNCHPAWMTPPANLYFVAQRVAAGCGSSRPSSRVADAQLAHIIIHEMGHAVEHVLLGAHAATDSARSEGFASWFEQFASDFSPVLADGEIRARYLELARSSFARDQNKPFAGSAEDYARASLVFHAIVARRGVRGLVQVYEEIRTRRTAFRSAIERVLKWDQRRLDAEVRRILERG